MFIMIDGIDGSGKSTVVETWREYLAGQGNPIFDLKKYTKEFNKLPNINELRSYDIIFSAEPTYTGIGKVIREELIASGTNYPVKAIAEAFSLDRLILYKNIIIPAIQTDRLIIQDRGVTTSLVYHTAQSDQITLDFVANLPGNHLSLQYRPDYLILIDCSAQNAISRIDSRLDKKDNVIFEKTEFLEKLTARYADTDYQKLFTDQGTKILHLNGNAKIDIMKAEALALIKTLIK